jgi:hypothetical protein
MNPTRKDPPSTNLNQSNTNSIKTSSSTSSSTSTVQPSPKPSHQPSRKPPPIHDPVIKPISNKSNSINKTTLSKRQVSVMQINKYRCTFVLL